MKKVYKIMALAAAVIITACQDENIVKQKDIPAQVGDEIVFRANSGYEMDARSSRTVYSGDSYTEGDKTYERIEWEPDVDIIGIYCEVANNKQYADYRVIADPNATTNTKIHTALLARHEQNSGLHWGSVDDHEFFAIYPSPTIPDHNSATTSLMDKVKLEGNTLTGYIPTTQPMIGDPVKNKNFTVDGTTARTATLWAKPDMRYSYMVARTTANPEDAAVNLEFHPISTALEIEITQPATAIANEVGVASITLHSTSGKPLTGYFTCDIDDKGNPTNIVTSNTSDVLTIQLDPTKTKLKKEETLRVTALMLPMTNIDDLEITISGDDDFGGDMHGALAGVKLTAHKKHYITNLPLKTPNPSNNMWISRLNDSILIGSLSIPATANSFSYAYGNNGINNDASSISPNYMTQSKSFQSQWDMGVRCFELVTDRPQDENTSLGLQALRCNNEDLDQTVSGAINKIWGILNADEISREEFVMVIFSYQPRGLKDIGRNPSAYMNSLCEFYNNLSTEIKNNLILYSPNLTVKDIRGKMLFIARPSQEGEDSDDDVEAGIAGEGYEILTVKGWGTLMDKWWRRGYETMIFKGGASSGNYAIEVVDQRSGFENYPAMEDWIYGTDFTQMMSGNYHPYPQESKLTTTRPEKGSIRYEYSTDQGIRVWAQEWRRVVQKEVEISGTINRTSYTYSFFESLSEKKNDILSTYNKAINDTNREMVYFNSLDGFYMLEDDYVSYGPYWVGNKGNIYGYAANINSWFYNEALSKAAENGTGTMGIIIMDYIGEDLSINGETISGSLLPKIVYNNNFKSVLPKGIPGAYKNESGGGTGGEGDEDDGGFGGGNEDE